MVSSKNPLSLARMNAGNGKAGRKKRLEIVDLVQVSVVHLEGNVVRRKGLGPEVRWKPVVLLAESGPDVEIVFHPQHGFAQF